MALLLFYLFLALGVSFLCSILEAVLLSISPSYITLMQEQGGIAGRRLKALKEDVDRPLAALLSLNTIAHTVGAAGVGAQSQTLFGNGYLAITSALVTLGILVISEIIPKTLGATYWRGLAPFSAAVLRVLVILLYPLVLLSMGITRLLTPNEPEPAVSRAEFRAMADQGEADGVFALEESQILRNLLHFESLRVKDVLTPRVVMVAFAESATATEVFEQLGERRISRLPVFSDDHEDITGFVLLSDVLIEIARDRHHTLLSQLKRDVLVVPETLSLYGLFRKLLERQEQLSVVVDEYGGIVGVATMEDIVETMLGMEIMDEGDHVEDMRVMARQRWLKRARKLGLVTEDDERIEAAATRPPA
ncbi:CNNM domain-containing protein [Salinisphaera aquimarina]|uniref:CNNM domain-containing protein n=1 Tax=Salinisphaera aquimarina TaxID=2094031 RepID=A0ABV7EIB2_9GAMM